MRIPRNRRARDIAADIVCVGTPGAAAALGVCQAQVRKLLASGELRGVLTSGDRGDWRIRLSDLEAYLRSRRRKPTRRSLSDWY